VTVFPAAATITLCGIVVTAFTFRTTFRGEFARYSFSHDDYDGAEDSNDNRYGYGRTIEACKAEIDEIEEGRI
jgi:hypothetical protein